MKPDDSVVTPALDATPRYAADSALPPKDDADTIQQLFARQRSAFATERFPSYATRLDRLNRLLAMIERIGPDVEKAVSDDFGHRSAHVTRLTDVMVASSAIRHAQRRLRGWMKPRRVPTTPAYWPGRSRVQAHPLGVVGVVSPWNYPLQLALGPAASALAAGNRVMIKPSELTPRFAALLQRAVRESFTSEELTVVTGDAEQARAFVALPFDHLLFTGSTAVGRKVALAAAANLTPVTLELGGKSPVIFNGDCDLAEAVPRLMAAKLLNSGQTCIAPDYLLVHERLLEPLTQALRSATSHLYPTVADNADYTSIVDARHAERLQGLLDDARALGARVLPLHGETVMHNRKMPPYLVLDVDDRMKLMREEIFGPILPVLSYRRLDDAIAYINRHDRPLALYWFGRDRKDLQAVLEQTLSGGVTINDCLWHVAQEALPFGGVGASGIGSYHGEHGFRTFSHVKPVFLQSARSGLGLMAPPYGRTFRLLERWVRKIS
ncbi:MAG TPA: coniferyl aldehyde dehydrogenase [Lautropia sp.]|nr:coniferyl aldehyde dehydrogenase [Lautropia sp.]